jgi:hypothetical protein
MNTVHHLREVPVSQPHATHRVQRRILLHELERQNELRKQRMRLALTFSAIVLLVNAVLVITLN